MEILYMILAVVGFVALIIIAITVMGRANRLESDPPTRSWHEHAEQQIRRERIEKLKLTSMDLWKE